MTMGDFPEIMSQQILAGIILVIGRLGVRPLRRRGRCVGVCVGYESGDHRGTHQMITLSVELCKGVLAFACITVSLRVDTKMGILSRHFQGTQESPRLRSFLRILLSRASLG